MSIVTTNNENYAAIASAIREKLGVETTYKPAQMAEAVASITTGGGGATQTLLVTGNGSYTAPEGVAGYSPVIVDVPARCARSEQVALFDFGKEQSRMSWNDGQPLPAPPTPEPPTIASWASGTDEQIAALIDAARAGIIDLQSYAGWAVGDVRTVSVAAFTGGRTWDSENQSWAVIEHEAQNVRLVISSFADYNNSGSVMQFDFADALAEGERMNDTGDSTPHPSVYVAPRYNETTMFTTVLPALANALPSWLRTRLKTFSVLVACGEASGTYWYDRENVIETVTGNRLALRAEVEVFGSVTYSLPGEGSLIPLFADAANRVKGGYAGAWWLRSPKNGLPNRSWYCTVRNGAPDVMDTAIEEPVAPFGCL